MSPTLADTPAENGHEGISARAWRRFVHARFPDLFVPEPVTELVYDADAEATIKARWAQAKFTDASDFIHEGRFEVTIPDCDEDEFYAVMILEGWSGCCLGWELRMHLSEHREDVRRVIDQAKAMKEAGYVSVG